MILSRAAAGFSIAVGAAVVVGWLIEASALQGLLPGLATMKVNTALCFILGGIALGLFSASARSQWTLRSWYTAAGLGATVLMFLFAALILSEDLFRWNAGLDELFVIDQASRSRGLPPGRMAPATSASFVSLGIALIAMVLGGRRGAAMAQLIACGVALVAVIALLGYAYGVSDLYGVWPFSSMALHTALVFFVLSNGILAMAPDRGWVRELTGDGASARMGRLLMFGVLFVPPLIGWFRLVGERQGHYGTQFGVGLMVVGSMSILALIVWIVTYLANRSESRIVQLSRLYSVLSHINQLIVRDSARATLMRQACEVSAREGGYSLTAIFGLADAVAAPVVLAYAGGGSRAMPVELLAPLLVGCTKHPAVGDLRGSAQALATELDDTGCIQTSAPGGSGAITALPLRQRNRVTGAFVFVSDDAQAVDTEELSLLREIAGDISFALDKLDVEAERRKAEESLRLLNVNLERKVVERTADLEFSNRELEAFAYSVSHDLRAPLRTIDGYASILAEDHGGGLDAEAHRILGVIRRNCDWMGRMIDDLLRLSRLGRQPLNLVIVDMAGIVRDVWREVCRSDHGRSAQAEPPTFIVGELPSAYADPSLIRHVWSNLLSNAVKYSGNVAQARIEVSAAKDRGTVTYSVKDNGAGFNMKYYDKLFSVFQRLHTAEEFPGSGVGLAIVSRLLTRQGGRIWAEGVHGAGATFYFSLPARAPERTPGAAPAP